MSPLTFLSERSYSGRRRGALHDLSEVQMGRRNGLARRSTISFEDKEATGGYFTSMETLYLTTSTSRARCKLHLFSGEGFALDCGVVFSREICAFCRVIK